MHDVVLPNQSTQNSIAPLASAVEQAAEFAANARAANTRRAYRADWRAFTQWCALHSLESNPATAQTLALHVSTLAAAGKKMATIQRRLSAVAYAHRLAGHASPTSTALVATVVAGIRRTIGVAQRGKAPVLLDALRAMVDTRGSDTRGLRDRALLLVGFAGAFRRSELVGLDVADVEFVAAGMVLNLRRSKSDQEGVGRRIGVPFGAQRSTCPVRSLRAWLEAAGIKHGPIYRAVDRAGRVRKSRLCDRAVALVVKSAAEQAGLDPHQFAGHSLRAGLATAAAAAGASERAIMEQTGHRSLLMVRRYIRDGNLFRENAAASIGL